MEKAPLLLQALMQKARVKAVPAGQIIVYEDDPVQQVFVIKQGIIKLHNIDDKGNDKVLHLLQPGAVMPLAFYSGRQATTTRWYYTALTDSELYVLANDTLQSAVEKDSRAALYLFNKFSGEVHEIIVRLDSLNKSNVHDKVMAALRYFVACHTKASAQQWRRVTFSVNHQLIADMIGITRESTTVAMKRLADDKIIRYPKLTVLEINTKKLYT